MWGSSNLQFLADACILTPEIPEATGNATKCVSSDCDDNDYHHHNDREEGADGRTGVSDLILELGAAYQFALRWIGVVVKIMVPIFGS